MPFEKTSIASALDVPRLPSWTGLASNITEFPHLSIRSRHLSVPESRLITIQPWDSSVIGEVEKAILKSDLGLTPSSDGRVIKIPIPPLTEERRKQLVRMVKKLGEDCKVAIRNVRREGNDDIKSLEKDKKISEDELRRAQDQIQKLTDRYIAMCGAGVDAKGERGDGNMSSHEFHDICVKRFPPLELHAHFGSYRPVGQRQRSCGKERARCLTQTC